MEKLNVILQRHVADGDDTANKLLGAAFVVVNAEEVLYSGSAGRIDFDAGSRAFAGDTFTWVASATKLITVTCVMQLVERGAVGLDDDARQIVPELGRMQILRGFRSDEKPILEDNTRPITLRMLLTHTAGLPYDTSDADTVRWSKAVGRKVNHLSFSLEGLTTPLKFPPGEGWVYGSGIDWAGLVLERVTGQTLGAYTQTHVFDPLGMHDTGFWPEKLPQTASRTAPSTRRTGASLAPFRPPLPKEHDLEGGGAGLYTTADDYGRFLRGFLRGRLLSEETMQAMFTPQLDGAQRGMLEATAYSAGVHPAFAPEFPAGLRISSGLGGLTNLEDVPGKRRRGSLMWSGAGNSRWWIDRRTGIAAVMVANVFPHGEPVTGRLYDELERAVYGHLVGKADGVDSQR